MSAPALPAPRGPLSDVLVRTLRGDAVAHGVDPGSHADEALSLWMLHELHHRGFQDVADDLEWDPALIALRGGLESRLEARWRERAHPLVSQARARLEEDGDLSATFFALCEADTGGESLARFVQREADADQVRDVLVQRTMYHVREQDPTMWALPRLEDETKAHLVAIAADEYGNGRPDALHAELWRRGMESLGLDSGYAAYVDQALPEVLEQNNLMTLLGLHRRLVPAALGHLAAFEVTSAVPSRRMVRGMERLGMPDEVTDYYREHMVADAVHEQVAVRKMLGSHVAAHPHSIEDVLWGGAVCLLAEQETATAVLALVREQQDGDRAAERDEEAVA